MSNSGSAVVGVVIIAVSLAVIGLIVAFIRSLRPRSPASGRPAPASGLPIGWRPSMRQDGSLEAVRWDGVTVVAASWPELVQRCDLAARPAVRRR